MDKQAYDKAKTQINHRIRTTEQNQYFTLSFAEAPAQHYGLFAQKGEEAFRERKYI